MSGTCKLPIRAGSVIPVGRCRSYVFLGLRSTTIGLTLSACLFAALVAGLSVAALIPVAAGVCLLVAVQHRTVRNLVSTEIAAACRRRRAASRAARLRQCGSERRAELAELSALGDEIHRDDPAESDGIEELLELYVRHAVVAERLTEAAATAASLPLPGDAAQPVSALHRDIVRRRVAHRDDCLQRATELHRQLDAIGELVRLVAQRAACPAQPGGDDGLIAHRLWEMDVRDEALAHME